MHFMLFQFNTWLFQSGRTGEKEIREQFEAKVREIPGVLTCHVTPLLLVIVYDGSLIVDGFKIEDPFVNEIMPWAITQPGFFPQREEVIPGGERYFGETYNHYDDAK